jgi:Flp pilus assembly protein TadD
MLTRILPIPLLLFLLAGGVSAWALPDHSSQALGKLDRPEEARQHNERGITLAREGKYVEAVREFRAAIEISLDDAEAHYNLGLSLNQLGESDQALEEFRNVARLRPTTMQT